MIITEFYRHQIAKLDDLIKDAESNKDFNEVARRQKEKSKMKDRLKQDWGLSKCM